MLAYPVRNKHCVPDCPGAGSWFREVAGLKDTSQVLRPFNAFNIGPEAGRVREVVIDPIGVEVATIVTDDPPARIADWLERKSEQFTRNGRPLCRMVTPPICQLLKIARTSARPKFGKIVQQTNGEFLPYIEIGEATVQREVEVVEDWKAFSKAAGIINRLAECVGNLDVKSGCVAPFYADISAVIETLPAGLPVFNSPKAGVEHDSVGRQTSPQQTDSHPKTCKSWALRADIVRFDDPVFPHAALEAEEVVQGVLGFISGSHTSIPTAHPIDRFAHPGRHEFADGGNPTETKSYGSDHRPVRRARVCLLTVAIPKTGSDVPESS